MDTQHPSKTTSSAQFFKESMACCMACDDFDDNVKKRFQVMKRKIVNAMVMLHWLMFLCSLGCLLAALFVARLRKLLIWGVSFWKWCVFFTVTFFGLLVIKLFMGLTGSLIKKYLMNTKLLFFVYSLRKSIALFIWMVSVFLVWVCLINRGVQRSKLASLILNHVTWTLVSLAFGSFLLVLKSLSLKLLASKFQMNAYLDRIQENLFGQYALEVLSGPPLLEEAVTSELSLDDKKRAQTSYRRQRFELGKLLNLRLGNISAWTVKKLVNIIRNSTLSINSQDIENPDDVTEITSEAEARVAAKKLFMQVARSGSRYIVEDDLARFIIREEVNMFCHQIVGYAETGKITEEALQDWVIYTLRERKALALALCDTKTVIKQLSKLMSGIVAIVVIIVWMLTLKITSSETIAIFLTAVAFTFGNTCKNIFEAAVFVFLVHPFDVGDRCVVDGIPLLVEEMGILTTIFLKLDNEKVFYPNSVLATKPISNYNRSPDMGETMLFTIDFTTPTERIDELKVKVKEYVESNPVEWYPTFTFVVKEVETENKLKLSINCAHKTNFQDYAQRQIRRTKLIIATKKMFEELNMHYNLVPQQARVINNEIKSESSDILNK